MAIRRQRHSGQGSSFSGNLGEIGKSTWLVCVAAGNAPGPPTENFCGSCSIVTIVSTSCYMFSVMYTFLMQHTCKCASH